MTDEMNTIESTQLLEAYAKDPIAKGAMDEYTVRYEEGNPTCGDGLAVYLQIDGARDASSADQVIRAYQRDGDAKVVATAAASLLAEYIVGETVQTVMQRDHETMAAWGLVVSAKRQKSVVLPLLAVRNAIHRRYNDQIIEDFEDILGW